ncbi:hypothetical protein NA57DRAFT_58315 [Rhizodiscina lignyota]|uniref:Uncharacterized protein n=1 Tax=Rhizodiscina lignyota TaxID=1504668 RepID=A0A9P4IB04_9PEZI|nr:hypothetical protein NA57DRAFT_58315 [Rhizodiscina lignyota]
MSVVYNGSLSQRGLLCLRCPQNLPENLDVADMIHTTSLSETEFPYTYDQLKDQGMPARCFPKNIFLRNLPAMSSSGEAFSPIFGMQIYFFDGGMIVATICHHGIFSGEERAKFTQTLASNCKNIGEGKRFEDTEYAYAHDQEAQDHIWASLTPPPPYDWRGVLKQCPEFTTCEGGNEEPIKDNTSVTSRLFTFSAASIRQLKDSIINQLSDSVRDRCANTAASEDPGRKDNPLHSLSSFVCLTALVWHHLTLARVPRLDPEEPSSIFIPVNLRMRGLVPSMAFPGCSILEPCAELPVAEVASSAPDTLFKLAQFVRNAIDQVDHAYLSQRLQLFTSIPDVTELRHTGETARCRAGFKMNNWAMFGADAEWNIVGTATGAPEWVRKPWSAIEGYAIVLPRKNDPDADWEVTLGLREEDMEQLLGDNEFMASVKRVVE